MKRIAELIPYRLAWPAGAVCVLCALAGSGLILYGTGFGNGSLAPFVWAAVAFASAAVFWHIADLASSGRPL